jgi:hypothetical protein
MWRLRPRSRPARGQSLVEFSLFVSVMLLLLMGLRDMGGVLGAHQAAQRAVRQAVLSGAIAGADASADCQILAAAAVALTGQSEVAVQDIIIYQPDSSGQPFGGNVLADVYSGDPGCANPASPPVPTVQNWPSSLRVAGFYANTMIGIEIEYTYTAVTTLFLTGPLALTETAVMPIIPG